MNHNHNRPIHTMRIAAVLLVLVLISTSIVTGRFARYVSSGSKEESARIAAYVFDVSDTQAHFLDISTIRKPGDSITCQFTVSNHNGTTSEVDEEFFLTLDLQGSLPLVCTLSQGDEKLVLDAETMDSTGLVTATGETHRFSAAVQSGITYDLIVSWPETENDICYSHAGLAQLVLTVAAQQVD